MENANITDQCAYEIKIHTGTRFKSGTLSNVYIELIGKCHYFWNDKMSGTQFIYMIFFFACLSLCPYHFFSKNTDKIEMRTKQVGYKSITLPNFTSFNFFSKSNDPIELKFYTNLCNNKEHRLNKIGCLTCMIMHKLTWLCAKGWFFSAFHLLCARSWVCKVLGIILIRLCIEI